MKMTDFLLLNNALNEAYRDDLALFVRFYNEAHRHVKTRMMLYPKLFKLTFTGACNLNVPVSVSSGGEVHFKEITEVIGQTLLEDKPEAVLSTPYVTFGVLTGYSSGENIFFSHNYLYAETATEISVPCVGHLYPPCAYKQRGNAPIVTLLESHFSDINNLYIPDAIVFPLTAKLYSIIRLDNMDVSSSNGYDALCNDYLNIRNGGLKNITTKTMASITTVTPYDLL